MRRISARTGFIYLILLLFLPQSISANPTATWLVTNPGDSGPGTLRDALLNASDGDTITFEAGTFPPGTPVTISVLSVLPSITQNSLIIDASNAGVIIDGTNAPGGTNGLIMDGDGNTIRGLTIQNFSSNGIFISPGASNNTIGGDRSTGSGPNGQGNLISNNGGNGIEIRGPSSTNNILIGNYIGVYPSGNDAWGNSFNGIAIWAGANNNVVGSLIIEQRNLISGNDQNGVWIGGTGSDQNQVLGNYIGTRVDGLGPVGNGLAGVSLQNGAANNIIGGTAPGAGNLISGNASNGIYMGDSGTSGNQILGNRIGTNIQGTAAIGQGYHGVLITLGASGNFVGDGTASGRNLISGNQFTGVAIEGSSTQNNIVQGNSMGTNLNGTAALPNGLHGIVLQDGTHNNVIGGNRFSGQGNLLSGNLNHGLVLTDGAHDNTISGNLIGPDAGGTYSLGYQPYGGIDVADNADNNTIGGTGPGEGNVISGNGLDGIALFDNTGNSTNNTLITGNLIGLTADGTGALPNETDGIFNVLGAVGTTIENNTISGNLQNGIVLAGGTSVNAMVSDNQIGTNLAGTGAVPNQDHRIDIRENSAGNTIGPGNQLAYNLGYGIRVAACSGNIVTQNVIHDNGLGGIDSACLAPPVIHATSTNSLTGTTLPNAQVEIFSDDGSQGRTYEGSVTADGSGNFTFTQPGGFAHPNVTASSTSSSTSSFSLPIHTLWTLLIYMNADNNLEPPFWDAFQNLAAADPNPIANVLILYDGSITNTQTILYDLTYGAPISIDTDLSPSPGITLTVPGELNMGDGQTLEGFVTWGRDYYPSQYTMVSILDHGGGWAPSTGEIVSGALRHDYEWLGGVSGLSWDETSEFDYLDSPEIKETMAAITSNGADPIDILYFDACLMGMIENAYQVKDYADYFIASQNIGWAPVGPGHRYIQLLQSLTPSTEPLEMAQLTVLAYANTMPPNLHPYTVSAIDTSQLVPLAIKVDQLGLIISQTLTSPAQADLLYEIYNDTQKLDYDGDFFIEPATDGFVDLYDFAYSLSQQHPDPNVVAAAQTVRTALENAVVAEAHQSGPPWFAEDRVWNLDDTHGLSIFLPFGEDLEIPTIQITETVSISPTIVISRNLRLRELYSSTQLDFAQETNWASLIETYYQTIGTPISGVPAIGPVAGLQDPDVSPPETMGSIIGSPVLNGQVTIHWESVDLASGLEAVSLWHRIWNGIWTLVQGQLPSTGEYVFTLTQFCQNSFAILGTDKAGNTETNVPGINTMDLIVQPCYPIYLPSVFR